MAAVTDQHRYRQARLRKIGGRLLPAGFVVALAGAGLIAAGWPPGVLLAGCGIAVCFAGGLIVRDRSGERDSYAFREFGSANGFSPTADVSVPRSRLWERSSRVWVADALRGKLSVGSQIVRAGMLYATYEGRRTTACWVSLPRAIVLEGEIVVEPVATVGSSRIALDQRPRLGRITLESALFDARYSLYASTELETLTVRQLFQPSLIVALANSEPPLYVDYDSGQLVIAAFGHISVYAELLTLVDTAHALASSVMATSAESR